MPRFAIQNPYFIVVVCLIIAVVGVSSLVRMPRDRGHTERCRPELSSLKPDRLPAQGAVQCR